LAKVFKVIGMTLDLTQLKRDMESVLELANINGDPSARDITINCLNETVKGMQDQIRTLVETAELVNMQILEMNLFIDWVEAMRDKYKL